MMVEVCTRPLFSVGGTRCQRWPPASLENALWAPLPSTLKTAMPGRFSTIEALKPPPLTVLQIDRQLLVDEQLGVRTAFGSTDFDDYVFHGSSWAHHSTRLRKDDDAPEGGASSHIGLAEGASVLR